MMKSIERFEPILGRPARARLALALATLLLAWGGVAAAQVSIPGLPAAPKPAAPAKDDKDKPAAAPTRDNPEATVATTSGPIDVDKPVDDAGVEQTLTELLPQLPGVRTAGVRVKRGVVHLWGHVENNDVRDDVTAFTRRVEGVRLVLNRMKTDAQVLTGRELAWNVLAGFWTTIR